MKIILREDVAHLGKVGDVVEVKPGYGRNYLLPFAKAVLATGGNVKKIEHEKMVILARQTKLKAGASEIARRLAGVEVKIARKVGDQEKMYGSVTALDIVEALQAMKIQVDRRWIHLPEPLKTLGTHEVPVKIHAEVVQPLKVTVVPEQ